MPDNHGLVFAEWQYDRQEPPDQFIDESEENNEHISEDCRGYERRPIPLQR